jgi:hypothetical protein
MASLVTGFLLQSNTLEMASRRENVEVTSGVIALGDFFGFPWESMLAVAEAQGLFFFL